MQCYKHSLVLSQAEGAENGGAVPADVSAPSTSGAAADSPAPAANGEAATPGAEGTAKKVKKEKKVWIQLYRTALYNIALCGSVWASCNCLFCIIYLCYNNTKNYPCIYSIHRMYSLNST